MEVDTFISKQIVDLIVSFKSTVSILSQAHIIQLKALNDRAYAGELWSMFEHWKCDCPNICQYNSLT